MTAAYTDGKTVRVIFKCRACKHAWAHEYVTYIKRNAVSFYRRGESEMIESYQDGKQCPKCGVRRGITSNDVQGTYNADVKCDGRCHRATLRLCMWWRASR